MKLRLLLSTLVLLTLGAFNSNAQSTFYAVSPFDANFRVMDSTTMTATATIPLTSSTGAVTGANGLASEPCGPVYIVYKAAGSRYLGTIDPTTGVITEIGNLGDNVANITFANGVLLGVTGDGATVGETLYSIDVTTAVMTLVTALGNGNDGESIEFNPDDGLLYHWSGWGTTSVIMESINPITFAITPITLSGATLANVGASTYVGNNRFLISDVNDGGLKYITTSGVVSLTSNTNDTYKGMVFDGGGTASVTNTTAANDSICSGETAVLVCNNTGVTYEWFFDGVSTGNTNDTLNATVAGAYVCEIDNGSCTVASDTIHLTVSNVPTAVITPSPTATICPGDTVELIVNSGGGQALFQWTLDGTDIAGATSSSYFATAAGSYNVMKTNQNGCSDTAAVATLVTLSNLPNVDITPSPTATICAGDSVELTTSAGGGMAQWSLNGTDITGATGSSYFASTAGSYTVTKTNMNGCSATTATPTVVDVNPLPPVSLTPSGTVNFCAGDTVELTITTGGGGGSFQWYFNGTAISGATTNTYFASAEGAYNLMKTNMNGCSDTAAVATMLVDTCNNYLPELNGLSFDLYPNPASDFVSIDFNSFTNADITGVQLIGLDGKEVKLFNVGVANLNGMSIDVSDVNTGIYFVRVTTAYGQIVKEIVIE